MEKEPGGANERFPRRWVSLALSVSVAVFFCVVRISAGHSTGSLMRLLIFGSSREWLWAIPLGYFGIASLILSNFGSTLPLRAAAGLGGAAALFMSWALFVRTSDDVSLTLLSSIPFAVATIAKCWHLSKAHSDKDVTRRQITVGDLFIAMTCATTFYAAYSRFHPRSMPVIDILESVDDVWPSGKHARYKSLSFEYTEVARNDLFAALLRLQDSPEVRGIRLARMTVSGGPVKALWKLPWLLVLDLTSSDVRDEDFIGIESLEELTALYLKDTTISDAAITRISNLEGVEILDLAGTNVGDKAAKALSKMPNLRELRLNSTRVTDLALRDLERAKRLEKLEVRATRVTNDGVERLRRLKRIGIVSGPK